MSMIGNYRRITAPELATLRQHPDTIAQFLYPDEPDRAVQDRTLDIDKTWHAIHFLLHGDPWEGTLPLHDAVLGGEPLGDQDVGYGPARFLTPDQVRATAAELAPITFATLAERFDLDQLAAADIYPSVWDNADRDDELAYLQPNYEALVRFFTQAAAAGDAMLLYIN